MMSPELKQKASCGKEIQAKAKNQTLFMIFNPILLKLYHKIHRRLTTIALQFLIFVHQGNMNAQSIFTLECFLAMITIVAEMTREVNALMWFLALLRCEFSFPQMLHL